ncbi:MAG: HAD family phosphatase [Deltaproteobacteria bacterium]|nr:HAD family phosphatase [Deltaproteobacteria bacterium]MBW2383007.1 HAD family phosphatase [Deltaproteobacteria bacterium]MBW2695462.1 HAD family phosphatase [Deltaproteobacteria bacterium]
MVRAILWDNDGVLVDSEHLYFEASRDALREVEVDLTLDLFRDVNLRQGRSCFDLARDEGIDDERIQHIRADRDARFRARVRQGVDLMDGVIETLTHLHGRHPMAIVTSSHPDNLRTMHRDHAIDHFFEFVLAQGDYARSKPHPDPYLMAAERLGVEPAQCVVVEDSPRGLESAIRAGMPCLVVPNELTRAGDFSAATRVLGSIREVPGEVAALSLC